MPPLPPRDLPRRRAVEIVCHQGANEYAPANTYAAAQICVDWGMDYVEIDVNTSKDGVLYVYHGPDLEVTTDGCGLFHELTAAEIDCLDAGSWFDQRFAGARVPRLDAYLRWIKGKAKLFFDVKRADLSHLLALIHEEQMQDDCFFWFGDPDAALAFRRLAPDLALKVNADDAAAALAAHDDLAANIIETGLDNLNQEFVDVCRARGMKLMVFHKQKDPAAFRAMLDWGVELINCDHGDVVAQVAAEHATATAAGHVAP